MNVLIVGGGITGSALAILLARAGVTVDVAELEPAWSTVGSGITLQGNALRVLRELGVWERVKAGGYGFDSFGMRAPDGTLLFERPDMRTGGPDLPATLGMYRPDLQAVLVDAALEAGARITLGRTVVALQDRAGGAADGGGGCAVTFDDGSTGAYDLVVGADGIHSAVRALIGVDARPQPVGMGIWRVHARRPESVRRTDLVYGGPCYIAGYCPTGEDTLYAYLVEKARDRASVPPGEKADLMRALAEPYGGAWQEIRRDITDPARVNYTWFESLLVERPWNRGAVVLVGDAAHACPPTLAQGAAMCLEDALVLAELLLERGTADQALFDAFMDRRFERVRTVVESSLMLARWQMTPSPEADVPGLMGRTATMLSELP
ncbi:FAD-dependent oxidoreductase [Streptosporangium sp. DT93]|uniref:FAD-dependent oxidoreductase n=1 Tax=Streptosporangium sp. DT93 TaxID=3393428 RepID=UPI003CECA4EB